LGFAFAISRNLSVEANRKTLAKHAWSDIDSVSRFVDVCDNAFL
jgi:hypothetical protein